MNHHHITTKITTLLPATVPAAVMQKEYRRAFAAFENIIENAGGSCDVDTVTFEPVFKFPVGSKVYHKNIGREEGLDFVEIPASYNLTPAALSRVMRLHGKRVYQPNVAVVTGHHINEDGSIGVVTFWWNPQFVEEAVFPENELEAV
jgi:hypothetical protein